MIASLLRTLARPFRRFAKREDGVMALEVILTLPVFIFCTMGCYTYWDAFRSLNISQKATYAVSDLLSRETRPVSEAYVNGVGTLMQYMVGDRLPVTMRVTSITYSGVRARFEVNWSRSPGNKLPQLTTASLQALASQIPMTADGDSIILVETNTQFTPAFGATPAYFMYLGNSTFQQFIVTRPRFIPKLCIDTVPCA